MTRNQWLLMTRIIRQGEAMRFMRALVGLAPGLLLAACQQPAPAPTQSTTPAQTASAPSPVERGKYLVTVGGCNDCHTPKKMGAKGPETDMDRMLSGHPETVAISRHPAPAGQQWMMTADATGTAFAGPWGVSFTANLTPDQNT